MKDAGETWHDAAAADRAVLGWLQTAVEWFFYCVGPPPLKDDLHSEGRLLLQHKLATYHPSKGKLSNYCHRALLTRWLRMVERDRREPPMSGWGEMLMGLRATAVSMEDSESADYDRLYGFADSVMAIDMLAGDGEEVKMQQRLDATRAMAALSDEDEPGRGLIAAMCEGYSLSAACKRVGITRAVGRGAYQRVTEKLRARLDDSKAAARRAP